MRTSVILDTNALLLFGQGVDVFDAVDRAMREPYELLLPSLVLGELERLAAKATRDGRAAKLGYALVMERLKTAHEPPLARLLFGKGIPLKTIDCSGNHADDAILRIAEDDPARTVVVTLDKELQHRLLARKVRVLARRKEGFAFK